MTISSEVRKSGPYTANGVTTAFDYEFKIADESHISVILTTSGAEAVVDPGDYVVSGVGGASGGQVTFNTAPDAGKLVTLVLDVPFTQQLDLENQGAFYAERIEAALDLCAQRDLQLLEKMDRSLKIPVSSDSTDLDTLLASVLVVYEYKDNVITVAGNIDVVITVAENITSIQNAEANAAAAAASASAASDSADNASTSEDNAEYYAGVAAAAAYSLLPGQLIAFAGSSVPAGASGEWLFCDGSAVSRTTYANLFEAIGTTWGVGDGSTTFNLPDLRGRTLAGLDNMGGTAANRVTSAGSGIAGATLGASGGDQTHYLTVSEMPSHNHGVNDPGHYHRGDDGLVSGGTTAIIANAATGIDWNTSVATTGITIQNSGGGGYHNNMQPSAMVNYLIKT